MTKKTSQLRRGDIILALDGHKLPAPVWVTKFVETLDDGTAHIEVEQPKDRVTSPDRWLRHDSVEVARPVTLSGVVMWKLDDETYRTPDGRFEVESDLMESWCDDAHPVRISAKLREQVWSHLRTNPQRITVSVFGRDLVEAVQWNKRGYYCYGGEIHTHTEWIAHDLETDWQGEWSETPSDAVLYIKEKI